MKLQVPMDFNAALPEEIYDYGTRRDGETHGVVLTKPHIVKMIFDLAGYRSEQPLYKMRLLEPACGPGAFVVEGVRRLIASCPPDLDIRFLRSAIAAYDIDPHAVEASRIAVRKILEDQTELAPSEAAALAEAWIQQGDFLLLPLEPNFDVVVGNPPYIRIEQLHPLLQAEYRSRFMTLFDRADLYVAFIERSLRLLAPGGTLSFICADRWTLNRYGAPLRNLVSSRYSVRSYIDLHQASPFESEVIAYPSIFVIANEAQSVARVAKMKEGSPAESLRILRALQRKRPGTSGDVLEYESWFHGDEPWIITSPEHRRALLDLETRFEPIETYAKVGIGVASGADRIFIVQGDDVDIERDRLVPLVMRSDIEKGKIRDANRYIINPFNESGRPIDLTRFPRLAKYFGEHREILEKRHVARKNRRAWYRTIDRVYPKLVARPKLLIPDIAGSNEVAFDPGRFHPHHNLYYVVSDQWDLEVLGGLLSSRVALFFIWSYAVKMRGGYLRFQAQYLRRIRVPAPSAIPATLAEKIRTAFRARDFSRIDALALEAYALDGLPEFDFVDTRS